jgi:hypothetical protein
MEDSSNKIVKVCDVIPNAKDKFGVDGHVFIAELRPPPAVHPRDLVAQIKDVLASRAEQLKDYKWLAGPWNQKKPLGGHIHFGVPLEDHFAEALNHQFAPLLALSEPAELAALRRTTKPSAIGLHSSTGDDPYGMLGDIRKKTWGFEYRTPSSFIVTPGVALGLITAGKAIIWEEIQGGSQAYSKLSTNDRKALEFSPEDFNKCNRFVFLAKLDLLKTQIAKMRYFEKGEEGSDLWPAIAYLLNKVIEKGGYSVTEDIKKKWKLMSNYTPPTKAEPQVFWKDLTEANHQWWLNNPLAQVQNQFVIANANYNGASLSNTVPQPQQWQWALADPETIWNGLQF